MYGVIMAGGEGTRLRPLTQYMPKPMVPIAGKPALARIVELLARNGIGRAAVTTMYLPEQIENFCAGGYAGVELCCFREEKPLGTAGSVRNTLEFLQEDEEDDSFLIISGDAVCDFDLTEAMEAHRKTGADATLLLAEKNPPNEYGVVLCAEDGSIRDFLEKPGITQTYGNTVNTGIYLLRRSVLESIPPNTFCDFGRDVFPRMLEQGMGLFGFTARGYWCDMGDLTSFYACSRQIAREEGLLTPEGNLIGEHCRLGRGACLTDCILLDGVSVGEDCRLDRAILCGRTTLENRVRIGTGAVIGENAFIGESAVVESGVNIAGNCVIDKGAHIMEDIFGGQRKADWLGEGGLVIDSDQMTGELAVRIGSALSAAAKRGRIGVMCTNSVRSRCVKESILCGAAFAGSNGVDLMGEHTGFAALAAFAAVRMNLALAVCVTEESKQIRIRLFDRYGLYPDRSVERALAGALASGVRPTEMTGRIERMEGLEWTYEAELSHAADRLTALVVNIVGTGEPHRILREALRRSGATVSASAGLQINLSPDGMSASARQGQSFADFWHMAAIVERNELRRGMRMLAVPHTAPDALRDIVRQQGGSVMNYTSCPHDDRENGARAVAAQQFWMKDGCFAAAMLCGILSESASTLAAELNSLPMFADKQENYSPDMPEIPLFELGDPAKEGVVFQYRQGKVKIIPRREGGYRLYADALSMEAADELLQMSKKRIDQLSRD